MPHDYRVRASRVQFAGRIFTVRRDEVAMPGGTHADREWVDHPGAVGVVALDERDRVVLLGQHRHPVGQRLWELPAGLLDVAGEPALDTASRELREEAGLAAGSWAVLLDALTSPGMSDEAVRIYLARELTEVDRPPAQDEESDLTILRVDLGEAVEQVLGGQIRNAMACLGLLAADRARQTGFHRLRPADAPWPDRPAAGGSGTQTGSRGPAAP